MVFVFGLMHWVGIDEVECGGDFLQFCNEWASKEMSATLWGAFVVICGHFYLISSGGMVALSHRSVNRALLLYPTNEEYARLLAKIDRVNSKINNQAILSESTAKCATDDDKNGEVYAQVSENVQAIDEVNDD